MSQVRLETPFTSFRGKICKHTQIIYKEMNGNRFTSQICNPRTKPFTAEEIGWQTKFRQAAAAARTVLADPTEHAAALAEYKAQTKYPTLYGYTFAREYAKL